MKKQLIAAIVGGIIIFFWQFLSNAALDLHRPAQEHTPKQDTILGFLKSQQLEQGRYFLPTTPKGASSEEQQALMSKVEGQPWAILDYHSTWTTSDMFMNMARGLMIDMLMVFLFVWLITRNGTPSFGTIVMSAVVLGFIAFLNFPYAYFIWYKSPGIWSDFMDAIVAWAACGVWLGWYLRK
ncbi:MAG TPA: hypothetical protein VLA58_03295 [Chitinophagaceae bacterium]|nr:hypothetical protein [Chitinophagaceae bacterium]